MRKAKCPHCGVRVKQGPPAGPHDQQFFCPRCTGTFEERDGALVDVPRVETNEYLYTIWFVSSRTRGLDWMLTLYKLDNEDFMRFRYRFRYDARDGKDPHNDNDRKSWWTGEVRDTTPDALRAKFTLMANLMAHESDADINDRIDIDGPASKLAELPSLPPWMHLKTVPLERA